MDRALLFAGGCFFLGFGEYNREFFWSLLAAFFFFLAAFAPRPWIEEDIRDDERRIVESEFREREKKLKEDSLMQEYRESRSQSRLYWREFERSAN